MLLKGSSWEKDVTAVACVGCHLGECRFSRQLLAAAISLTWQLPRSATGQASKIPHLLSDSLSISDEAWIASGFLCSPHCINERCYIKNSRWQQNPFVSPDAFGHPLFSHPPLTQTGRRLRKEAQKSGNIWSSLWGDHLWIGLGSQCAHIWMHGFDGVHWRDRDQLRINKRRVFHRYLLLERRRSLHPVVQVPQTKLHSWTGQARDWKMPGHLM